MPGWVPGKAPAAISAAGKLHGDAMGIGFAMRTRLQRRGTAFLIALFVPFAANGGPYRYWQEEFLCVPPPVIVYPASEHALYFPNRLPAGRVPYPVAGSREAFYFYDFVNRPYPFTPEPIWREMFPGIQRRIEIEQLTIGVPGQAAGELNYHASFRAKSRAEAAADKAEFAARRTEEVLRRINAMMEQSQRSTQTSSSAAVKNE